jgi:RNA polymerase-binding transcription factor DksA
MSHERFADALKERKAYLERSLDKIEATLDEPPSKDFEERASEREGDEVMETLGTAELAELRQINAALGRLEAGTYGICTSCGDEISDERLEVLPHTPMCRNCA